MLHHAAGLGHCDSIRLLIAKGAEIDAKLPDDDPSLGRTPLHLMAERNHGAALALLLEKGAGVNLADSNGMTALDLAALFDHCGPMRTLISKGAEIDHEGVAAPLHYAAMRNHPAAVEILLESGASINAREGSGATALHFAARYGHCDVIRVLLAPGTADVSATENKGRTALQVAAANQMGDAVRLLLAEA